MKTFLTTLRAVHQHHPDSPVVEWTGPNIQARDEAAAKQFCELKRPYLKVEGELIEEIEAKAQKATSALTYRQIHLRRMSQYNHCLVASKRALRLQMAPVLASVRAGESIDSVIHQIRTEPIEAGLLSIYTKVVPVFAFASHKHLRKGLYVEDIQTKKDFLDSFLGSQWIARARYYVVTLGSERIRKITETTRDKVRQFLTDAVQAGWSVTRTAQELSAYTQALNKSRAIVIARTELLSSSNYGSYVGAKSTGLKLDKFWIATKDSRTRDTHRHINGQTVDIDAPFKVAGYEMNYPGDTSLGAPGKEVIQCRCAIGFKPKS